MGKNIVNIERVSQHLSNIWNSVHEKVQQQKNALLISKKRVISFLKGIWQFRVRSDERRNELIPFWDFKPAWKQVLLTWSFISAAFQNDPIFWWICLGISFRVVFTWYFITRNEISFLSALSFKRTCALNATSNESVLINFVSGKLCSHENLMPVWKFISVKMTDMKSIPFWVSFHLNSCEHK